MLATIIERAAALKAGPAVEESKPSKTAPPKRKKAHREPEDVQDEPRARDQRRSHRRGKAAQHRAKKARA